MNSGPFLDKCVGWGSKMVEEGFGPKSLDWRGSAEEMRGKRDGRK